MSNLRTLIRDSKVAKKELVASTVRMPEELYFFIEDLAEHLSLSKQEMMLRLIEEGVDVAKKELKLEEIEEQVNSKFHILNTNKRHSEEAHEKMLKDGIAAASYDPWKYNINRINKGDVVFLYENKVGIVAYGKGTGNTLITDYEGDKDEWHYQKLEDFTILEKPLTAGEVKQVLGRNVVFLRVMSGMPDGQKVLDKILNYK